MIAGGKVAIVQPNYIPWKGYFDLIRLADHFIFLDDVQYTVRDWRNRNRIKTNSGLLWLSIPVIYGNRDQRIHEVKVAGQSWRKQHWDSIYHNYKKAAFFADYREAVQEAYLGSQTEMLADIDIEFIRMINRLTGIETPVSRSSDFKIQASSSERLLQLCLATGAGTYISGPSARSYLDTDLFEQHHIRVEWMDYSGYKEYRQLHPPFVHEVSMIDLLFNEGPDTLSYMKQLI